MACTKLFVLTCLVLVVAINAAEDAKKMWNTCKTDIPMGSGLDNDQKCAHIKNTWAICAINHIANSRDLMTMVPELKTCVTDEISAQGVTNCAVTVDTALIQQAAMDKCQKENDVTKVSGDTAKCANLNKIMGCVFTRLPPGDGETSKTTLQTEANTLAGSITTCTPPTINEEYITKQVLGECKDAAAVQTNPTDTQKCDALKERTKCSVGKLFKSFSGASAALSTLTTEVKKEAGNIKDCKADAQTVMMLAKDKLMGGASQAQVSFFALALTLTAVVALR